MTVEKRSLGQSGISVAPLALGGNVFGWTADEPTSFDILDAFVDAGGNMVDSADVYSAWVPGNKGGESETVIGNWLRRDPAKRDKIVLATKVGFFEGLAPEKIAAACDASLQRLGIDTIDLYYHHKDDPNVPLADSLGAMDALVKAGKIRSIGMSQYSPERLDEAMRAATADSLTKPSVLQTWYNLVEREELEGALRDTALAHGLGIIPFYGLANGFLTGKYRSKDDLDKSPRGLRNVEYLEGRGMRVLAALDRIAAETGAALASITLAWTIAQPGITAALASATSVDQLKELTAAMSLALTPEQIALLDEASR
ncbi:aldo/keto reductase [Sphingomonas sediminicola]|uniref:Aldo/keto reductase n=1 Tax=Sphingomonas sediminicola TaxID=386874 RepID=A0ABX6T8S6_9SPHN|nr:aldo/keto reductase [Sphingomonas sediminicola]QNP45811.1 aldo/keto reductase [Sphingomonas sediminicola]